MQCFLDTLIHSYKDMLIDKQILILWLFVTVFIAPSESFPKQVDGYPNSCALTITPTDTSLPSTVGNGTGIHEGMYRVATNGPCGPCNEINFRAIKPESIIRQIPGNGFCEKTQNISGSGLLCQMKLELDAPSGSVHPEVTACYCSSSKCFEYRFSINVVGASEKPIVGSVSPNIGDANGGYEVFINGPVGSFKNAESVMVGRAYLDRTKFTVDADAKQITIQSMPTCASSGCTDRIPLHILVRTPLGGTSNVSSSDQFMYRPIDPPGSPIFTCAATADLRSGGSADTLRITNPGAAYVTYGVQFVNPHGTISGNQIVKSMMLNQSVSSTIGSLLQQAGIRSFNPALLLQIWTVPKTGATESPLQSVLTPSNGTPPVIMVYTCEPEKLQK